LFRRRKLTLSCSAEGKEGMWCRVVWHLSTQITWCHIPEGSIRSLVVRENERKLWKCAHINWMFRCASKLTRDSVKMTLNLPLQYHGDKSACWFV
jgi:hypothetical protein